MAHAGMVDLLAQTIEEIIELLAELDDDVLLEGALRDADLPPNVWVGAGGDG